MQQAVPKHIARKHKIKAPKQPKKRVYHQKYGTSKLEQDFAKNFLDKLGLVYIYQFEAKDIKRFFDFAITCYDDVEYKMEEKDGIRCVKQEGQFFPLDLLIEIDGSYWHGDPRVVTEDKIKPLHKHNQMVDKIKDQWAGTHCIQLLRFWEYDIRKNPNMIIEEIKKYVKEGKRRKKIKENRKRPH